jgi:hypothetical protein
MNKFNSTIKRKKCKNENCSKYPKLGMAGFCSKKCMPEEMQGLEKYNKRSVMNRAASNLANLSRKVHSYQREKNKPNNELKSALLKKADNLFSKFIRERDACALGNVKCPCCGIAYNLKDKTPSGDYIVQALHFVSRKVYSLRFDERQVKAGCCYCNKDMFDFPMGVAYKNFRDELYLELGTVAVWMMEAEKRNINKLSHNDLEDIIKKYSITKK